MVPDLDKRTGEELKHRIETLAASYTPEWRYSREQPDAGSVLANMFAGLMEDTIGCYNRMPARVQAEFLEALGIVRSKPCPARGYVVFKLAREDMPASVVPEKTGLLADLPGQELIRFETEEDVYVSGIKVSCSQKPDIPFLDICFDCCPDQGVISLLLLLPEGERRIAGQASWEYLTGSGWKHIQIEDGTANLKHTGIIRFTGRPGWKRSADGDLDGYRLRISWTGKNPFAGDAVRVYINAGKLRAVQPGRQGNLPPGVSMELVKTIGSVSLAWNPDILYGGTDREPGPAAIARGCARSRHRFKAVTPGDFESLIYEQYPQARKVVCFSGFDKTGKRLAGAVTVVVVTEDYPEEGRYFYTMARELEQWLADHTQENLAVSERLAVIAPAAVRVSVSCELGVKSYGEVLRIHNRITESLALFLHPQNGNHQGRGWELGEIPDYDQIRNHLLQQPGIVLLQQLRIAYEIGTDQGFLEISGRQPDNMRWALPQAGRFQITVSVEGGV